MSLNLLNNKANDLLSHLDWEKVIQDITMVSYFEETKHFFKEGLAPKSRKAIQQDYEDLGFYLKKIDEITTSVQIALNQLPHGKNHRELAAKLGKGHICTISELNHFALILESYYQLFPHFFGWSGYQPLQENHQELKSIERSFLRKIRVFIDHHGNVDYTRHPELNKLNQELQGIEQNIRHDITALSKEDLYKDKLQFDGYDVLNDRYVLALRSDSYQSEQGIIIGRSNSGMTLFVEPYLMREKSNKRMRILARIEEELSKIAIEYSQLLHEKHLEIMTVVNFIYFVDLLNTKAQYCDRYQFCCPEIAEQSEISLTNLYHPLIEDPVKNNLILNSDKKGFIISGPNTGGKTVTLKSVALSYLFVHLGMFVPATDAKLFPYQAVYYFGNDQQNLQEGLSSFASETKNYLKLIQELDQPALIIIDEIFNSTSSEEASALAIALLDELHKTPDLKVLISTHHQVFKTFTHADQSYESAHVGYDIDEQTPTYRLHLGEPGSSMAFTIFDRLSNHEGVETDVPIKASKILDKKQVSYEKLLEDLSHRKSELDKLLLENRKINLDLKNQKESLEGLVFLEKEKLVSQYETKIKKILAQAEKHFENTKSGKEQSKKKFYQQAGEIKSQIESEKGKKEEVLPKTTPTKYSELVIGQFYFSLLLAKEVKILALNERKKEAQISHKGKSLWRSFKDLHHLPNQIPRKKESEQTFVQRTVVGKIEIDCRGMRLEEFQNTVEISLNELLAGDIPFLTIIHGHGTGALKKWLRDYLKNSGDFKWESLEGNDGCTKVELKSL